MCTPLAPARIFITGLSLIAAGVLAAPGARAQSGPPAGLSVRVVNAPTAPVPVVLGAPVVIDGSAPVPVSLGTPVTIDTSVPLPVSVVGDSAPQPIQIVLFQPTSNLPDNNRFRVPTGKRLVIEYASCSAGDADDVLLGLAVRTRVNGAETPHSCPFDVRVNVGRPGPGMAYRGARLMRVYADPGTDVVVGFDGIPAASFPFFSAVLSGHLVDVP
ncbi:hypothetical protein [Luteitalea sp.]|uniref:hypothetical protein n=1 Tax=Luteitalea sp. TaxID=2004800 RepID=UPI0025C30605|nr:hypothetical protein [Luteitalea sp.]